VTDNGAEFTDQPPLQQRSDHGQNILFRNAGLIGYLPVRSPGHGKIPLNEPADCSFFIRQHDRITINYLCSYNIYRRSFSK
jgi:hypothetical protein